MAEWADQPFTPLREQMEYGLATVRDTRRRAGEAVANLGEQVGRFKRKWYDRIDPFFYYDHTYNYKVIPEVFLTALSVLFFALCVMVSAGMGAIADYRHPGSGRLPDLGFTLIPEMTEYANVPNEFAKAAFVLTVGLVLLHPKRLMVLRRSLVIYSMVFLLRAICVVSTALPDPSPLCMGKKPFTPEACPPCPCNASLPPTPVPPIPAHHDEFWEALRRGFSQATNPFTTSTCGDLIFSGHTVSFVLCSLIWDRYFTGHRSRWPVYLYHFFVTTLGLISVIAARFHYTIDVVVAMIVTFTMWQRYHIFVDYRQLYIENHEGAFLAAEVPDMSTTPSQNTRQRRASLLQQQQQQRPQKKDIGHEHNPLLTVIETGEYTHLLPRKKQE